MSTTPREKTFPVSTTGSAEPHVPAAIDALERELKFVVPVARAGITRRWLQAVCAPDGRYPEADVWTVYYDTPGFESLDEKLNSDYLKMKIRVRWYGAPGGAAGGPAFVEAKLRVGNRRDKLRVQLPVTGAELASRPLQDPLFTSFPRLLASTGILVGPGWQPMLALRYRRRRLVEPASGTRVNLDSDIAAERANPRFLVASRLGALPLVVVEIKGGVDVLPVRLHPLVTFGARRQTFSKYAALVLHIQRLAV